jgi:hypothetical protein
MGRVAQTPLAAVGLLTPAPLRASERRLRPCPRRVPRPVIGMTGRRQLLRVVGLCARRGFWPHALVGGGERLWHPPQGAPGGRGPSGLPAAQRPARCAGRWTLGRGSECADAKTREWRCGSGVAEIRSKARLACSTPGLKSTGRRPAHAHDQSRRTPIPRGWLLPHWCWSAGA